MDLVALFVGLGMARGIGIGSRLTPSILGLDASAQNASQSKISEIV
jgi:hypothetical protein